MKYRNRPRELLTPILASLCLLGALAPASANGLFGNDGVDSEMPTRLIRFDGFDCGKTSLGWSFPETEVRLLKVSWGKGGHNTRKRGTQYYFPGHSGPTAVSGTAIRWTWLDITPQTHITTMYLRQHSDKSPG